MAASSFGKASDAIAPVVTLSVTANISCRTDSASCIDAAVWLVPLVPVASISSQSRLVKSMTSSRRSASASLYTSLPSRTSDIRSSAACRTRDISGNSNSPQLPLSVCTRRNSSLISSASAGASSSSISFSPMPCRPSRDSARNCCSNGVMGNPHQARCAHDPTVFPAG